MDGLCFMNISWIYHSQIHIFIFSSQLVLEESMNRVYCVNINIYYFKSMKETDWLII
jgi:hypothetical protein